MKIKVEYEDEQVTVLRVKPRHLLAFEDEHGEFTGSMRDVFRLAHICSGSKETLEEWLECVDDIAPANDKGESMTEAEMAEATREPVPTG